MTRASILVPIHDKPTTLPMAVDTALRQSVQDVEVLLVGDGVTDDVRVVARRLVAADDRVRFLDHPKGPHHGERYRHDAIESATSEAIFYLCDDDLLLPDHVADLLALLEDATFAMSLNGFWRPEGSMGFYPADLGNRRTIELILDESLRYNQVSVTGVAHTRSFYDLVGDRWDTTPAGQWADHHQWRKLMRHPAFRGATSARMTALQFPTSGDGRDAWTDEERESELRSWHELVTGPDAQATIDGIVSRDVHHYLAEVTESRALLRHELDQRYADVAELLAEVDRRQAAMEQDNAEHAGHHAFNLERIAALEARVAKLTDRLSSKNSRIDRLRGERNTLRDQSAAPPDPWWRFGRPTRTPRDQDRRPLE